MAVFAIEPVSRSECVGLVLPLSGYRRHTLSMPHFGIGRKEVGRLVEHVAPEYAAELSSATFIRSLLFKLAQELTGCWGDGSGIEGADRATLEVLGPELSENAVLEGTPAACSTACSTRLGADFRETGRKRANNEDDAGERVYLESMMPRLGRTVPAEVRLLVAASLFALRLTSGGDKVRRYFCCVLEYVTVEICTLSGAANCMPCTRMAHRTQLCAFALISIALPCTDTRCRREAH